MVPCVFGVGMHTRMHCCYVFIFVIFIFIVQEKMVLTRSLLLRLLPLVFQMIPLDIISIIVDHVFPEVVVHIYNVSAFPIRYRKLIGHWQHLYPQVSRPLSCLVGDKVEFGCGTVRIIREHTRQIIAHYSAAPIGSTQSTLYV